MPEYFGVPVMLLNTRIYQPPFLPLAHYQQWAKPVFSIFTLALRDESLYTLAV